MRPVSWRAGLACMEGKLLKCCWESPTPRGAPTTPDFSLLPNPEGTTDSYTDTMTRIAMDEEIVKTDLLIVGAGPAGAALACFLASHGE